MRYQFDKTMEFRHSGTILNSTNGEILRPIDFNITSHMTNIKNNDRHILNVQKGDEFVEITLPMDTLDEGIYEWQVYVVNDTESWSTPKVIVKVE